MEIKKMPKVTARIVCAVLIVALSTSTHALRSIRWESFTDPDYRGYRPSTILLLVIGANFEMREMIEDRLIRKFSKRGVTVIPSRDILPPTREWTDEEQLDILTRHHVDSGMIVTIGGSASSIIPVATQTFGTSSVFGSYNERTGTFSGSGSSQSTSYKLYSARSKAEFSAVLLDIDENRTVWYADVLVKASGTLFVSQKGDSKGLVNGIVTALYRDGHLPEKGANK